MLTSFEIAGLRIDLVSEHVIELPESYRITRDGVFSKPAALTMNVQVRSGFANNRGKSANYPAFEKSLDDEGRTFVSRTDAEGWISNGEPAEASFTVGESMFSLEAAVRVACSVALLHHNILLFHSSAVEFNGRSHMFAGLSGAGKSTIAQLLSEQAEFIKLSDELLVVRQQNKDDLTADHHGAEIIVSPFFAREELPVGRTAELQAIHLILQAPQHDLTPVSTHQATKELLRHVLTYANTVWATGKALELVASLVSGVPVYRLAFAKQPDVASVITNGF